MTTDEALAATEYSPVSPEASAFIQGWMAAKRDSEQLLLRSRETRDAQEGYIDPDNGQYVGPG